MVYSHTSYTTHDLARHINTDAGLHSYTYNPEGLGIFKQYSPTNNDDKKFTGHLLEQEGDLGIYHAQARMYDPAIGRFLGVDAMRSLYPGWSTYVYAMNNPVLLIDTTGNCPEDGSAGPNEYGEGECLEAVTKTADSEESSSNNAIHYETTLIDDGYEIYNGRVRFNPEHPGGARWLYNHFRENQSGCDNINNSQFSGASHSIAMMACQHAVQEVFLRNFLTYAGISLGVAGGAITLGGIVVGSSGLIATGSALGTGAAGINSAGHAIDGNYGAAISQAILAPMSTYGYNLIRSARHLTPYERLVTNNIIFKSENIGHMGVTITTTDRR